MTTMDLMLRDAERWPDVVRLHRGMPPETRSYVLREKRLPKHVTVDMETGIGHDECGACGRVLAPLARFCGACGCEVM